MKEMTAVAMVVAVFSWDIGYIANLNQCSLEQNLRYIGVYTY